MQPDPVATVSTYYQAKGRGGTGDRLTSTSNGLPILLVLDITRRKHTLHARQGSAGRRHDIPVLIRLELTLNQLGGGVVADGVEEAVRREQLVLATICRLPDDEFVHQAVLAAPDLVRLRGVPDGDLGMGQQAVGHGLASPQLVLAHEDRDVAGVLGQEEGLLGRGVAAADDDEGLVAEDGHGAIADGTRRDALLPVLVLTGEVKAARRGAGGDDDGVGSVNLILAAELGRVLEGPLRQVKGRDGVCYYLGAEPYGLLLHLVLIGKRVSVFCSRP